MTHRRSGALLIIIGLALIGLVAVWRFYQSTVLSFKYTPDQLPPATSLGSPPVAIDIDRINLHLAVTPATVTNGIWEISPTGASHWRNSANPGTPGNIVIYGHNKISLFGPIRWLEIGDTITLTAASGQTFTYTVTQSLVVNPDQVAYIQPTDTTTLTLYTCTGFLDRQRHIIIARPVAD